MNDEIKFKFVVGWYDGPLDGICEFNEKVSFLREEIINSKK